MLRHSSPPAIDYAHRLLVPENPSPFLQQALPTNPTADLAARSEWFRHFDILHAFSASDTEDRSFRNKLMTLNGQFFDNCKEREG
jgi:hypothetical protein